MDWLPERNGSAGAGASTRASVLRADLELSDRAGAVPAPPGEPATPPLETTPLLPTPKGE